MSKKYENYTTKLKCKCTKCGNITYKSLNMIQGPSPCKNCKQIKGIEKAKKIFKDKGCKLLENTYVDSCYCYELCMFLR